MRIEYYPVEKLKREILKIARKYIDTKRYRLFFFGSRVTGNGTDRSDIDIGIEGPKPVPLETISEIETEIEKLPTLYKIEIVDFARVAEKFRKVALKYTEPIN